MHSKVSWLVLGRRFTGCKLLASGARQDYQVCDRHGRGSNAEGHTRSLCVASVRVRATLVTGGTNDRLGFAPRDGTLNPR